MHSAPLKMDRTNLKPTLLIVGILAVAQCGTSMPTSNRNLGSNSTAVTDIVDMATGDLVRRVARLETLVSGLIKENQDIKKYLLQSLSSMPQEDAGWKLLQ